MPVSNTTAAARRAGAKTPQDRRPKDDAGADARIRGELDGNVWRFTVDDGDTWFESRPLTDVFTPKWARLNRRRDQLDTIYTAVEDCFDGDDDALEAWDSIGFKEQGVLGQSLFDAMGVSLGE